MCFFARQELESRTKYATNIFFMYTILIEQTNFSRINNLCDHILNLSVHNKIRYANENEKKCQIIAFNLYFVLMAIYINSHNHVFEHDEKNHSSFCHIL
jgi:hypothetical protein